MNKLQIIFFDWLFVKPKQAESLKKNQFIFSISKSVYTQHVLNNQYLIKNMQQEIGTNLLNLKEDPRDIQRFDY